MLRSPDVENHMVAFGILEQQDIKNNEFDLMMCYKFGKPTKDAWEKECPNVIKGLTKNLTVVIEELTFNTMFNYISSYNNVSDEAYAIFFKEYEAYLNTRIGTDIEGITIKVNHKKK